MIHIKINDFVVRKSHNCDVLFIVNKIIKDRYGMYVAILKGITIRIIVDSFLNDLIVVKPNFIEEKLRSFDESIEDRLQIILKNNSKIIEIGKNLFNEKNGKILHLDGDTRYSQKSLKYYKKIGLNAVVKNIAESKQPTIVKEYLIRYNPDILVLTGHDGMLKLGTKYKEVSNYRNSKYFMKSVQEARKTCPSSNKLAIFAGACQSFFEGIMASGANFASSPARILIDFMDPIVVAEKIAITSKNKYITINDIEQDLRDGKKGIDGCGVMGKRKL